MRSQEKKSMYKAHFLYSFYGENITVPSTDAQQNNTKLNLINPQPR